MNKNNNECNIDIINIKFDGRFCVFDGIRYYICQMSCPLYKYTISIYNGVRLNGYNNYNFFGNRRL